LRKDSPWTAMPAMAATSWAETKLMGLRPGPNTSACPLLGILAPMMVIQVSRNAAGRMIVQCRPLVVSSCSAAYLARCSDIG
jgi:hypothetical protein